MNETPDSEGRRDTAAPKRTGGICTCGANCAAGRVHDRWCPMFPIGPNSEADLQATDALSNAVTGALEGIVWLYVGLAFAVIGVVVVLAIYSGGAK